MVTEEEGAVGASAAGFIKGEPTGSSECGGDIMTRVMRFHFYASFFLNVRQCGGDDGRGRRSLSWLTLSPNVGMSTNQESLQVISVVRGYLSSRIRSITHSLVGNRHRNGRGMREKGIKFAICMMGWFYFITSLSDCPFDPGHTTTAKVEGESTKVNSWAKKNSSDRGWFWLTSKESARLPIKLTLVPLHFLSSKDKVELVSKLLGQTRSFKKKLKCDCHSYFPPEDSMAEIWITSVGFHGK